MFQTFSGVTHFSVTVPFLRQLLSQDTTLNLAVTSFLWAVLGSLTCPLFHDPDRFKESWS